MNGMAAMVFISEGKSLAKRYGAVVLSPEYRLARKAPYPAALDDCFAALRFTIPLSFIMTFATFSDVNDALKAQSSLFVSLA